MILTLLKGKLHRAVVTESNMDYEGSIRIDADLMKAAGILTNEQVDVYNIANGERFTTYAVPGQGGQREICVMGAAAHLVNVGDKVIIVAFAQMTPEEAATWKPKTILLDEKNNIKS